MTVANNWPTLTDDLILAIEVHHFEQEEPSDLDPFVAYLTVLSYSRNRMDSFLLFDTIECTQSLLHFGTIHDDPPSPDLLHPVRHILQPTTATYYLSPYSATPTIYYSFENTTYFLCIHSQSIVVYGSIPIKWASMKVLIEASLPVGDCRFIRPSPDGLWWIIENPLNSMLSTPFAPSFFVVIIIMPINSNSKSVSNLSLYRLSLVSSTSTTSSVSFAFFSPVLCNLLPIDEGLFYLRSTMVLYDHYSNVYIEPISSGYTNYSLSPPLPSGLSMSPHTGIITGHLDGFTSVQPISYLIQATSTSDSTHSTFNLTLSYQSILILQEVLFLACGGTSGHPVRILKRNGRNAIEESIVIRDLSTQQLLFSFSSFNNYQDFSTVQCITQSLLQIELSDSLDDGWDNDSNLLFIHLLPSSEHIFARFTHHQHGTSIHTLHASFIIKPQYTNWYYLQNRVPYNWYIPDYSYFNKYPINSNITSLHHIWIFKTTISMTSNSDKNGIEMCYLVTAGVLIYVNQVEIYRQYLNPGLLDKETQPTVVGVTPSYRCIVIPMRRFTYGTNTIAIGIVNHPTNIPPTMRFDCFVHYVYSSESSGRLWDVQTTSLPASLTLSNLFDLNPYTTTTFYMPSTSSLSIYVNLGSSRAEALNYYCLISSYLPFYDPMDWTVYGCTSDRETLQYEELGSVSNAYFSSRFQQRCFYLPFVTTPYQIYHFRFTKPYRPDIRPFGFSLSSITLGLVNIDSIVVPPLSYSTSTHVAYVGVPFPDLVPNSLFYCNYQIDPPLPEPLIFDTTTGSIRGTPTQVSPSSQYTITGILPNNTLSSTVITIEIQTCHYPNVLFTLEVSTASIGSEIGFQLNATTPELYPIQTVHGFPTNSDTFYSYCQPIGEYILRLYCSNGNGWGDGSYKIYLQDQTILLHGSLGQDEYELDFPLFIGYIISPEVSVWKYNYEGNDLSPDWYSIEYDDSDWSESAVSQFPETDSVTLYFRKQIDVSDYLSSSSSSTITIKTKYGFILYINNVDIKRYNLDTVENEIVTSHTPCAKIFEERQNVTITLPRILQIFRNSNRNMISIELHRRAPVDEMTRRSMVIDFDCTFVVNPDHSYRILNGQPTTSVIMSNSIDRLFDNIKTTYTYTHYMCTGFVAYYTLPGNYEEFINSYTIITSPKCNKRTPSGWILSGSKNGYQWKVLDKQTDQIFTHYSSEKQYSFFTEETYNQFRFEVIQCNNTLVSQDTVENYAETCGSMDDIGFQLAELQLHSNYYTASCPVENGYSGALEGGYGYKDCPHFYKGTISALCKNGHYMNPIEECSLDAPYYMRYDYPVLTFHPNRAMSYTPYVDGLYYTCSLSSPLPEGLSFDSATGKIEGTPAAIFSSLEYTVECTNAIGSVSTVVHIISIEYTSNTIWIWSSLLGFILLVVMVYLSYCMFYRYYYYSHRKVKPLSLYQKNRIRRGGTYEVELSSPIDEMSFEMASKDAFRTDHTDHSYDQEETPYEFSPHYSPPPHQVYDDINIHLNTDSHPIYSNDDQIVNFFRPSDIHHECTPTPYFGYQPPHPPSSPMYNENSLHLYDTQSPLSSDS